MMDISLMDGSWLPFAATAAADARRRVLALGIRWMLTASQPVSVPCLWTQPNAMDIVNCDSEVLLA
jgi:hypothetical protein